MTSFERKWPFCLYKVHQNERRKQRTAIKFCVLNGKKRKKTMEMLVKAYGDAAMKRTALHKWYSRYETDTKCDGRTAQRTSDVKNVAEETSSPVTDHAVSS